MALSLWAGGLNLVNPQMRVQKEFMKSCNDSLGELYYSQGKMNIKVEVPY